jgi:predicted N-acetyltransferase YhbS
MTVQTVTGARSVRLACALLRRMRLARPGGGIWEAADVQWWSRQERPTDAGGQLFWPDQTGEPAAAVLRTDFGGTIQCDVLCLPGQPGRAAAAWQAALDLAAAPGGAAEFPVRPDDAVGVAALTAAGYRPGPPPGVISSWLPAARRPAVPPLPPGYRLLSRAESGDRPHPLAARNGPQVEARLRQCDLYDPGTDLMVEAPGGQAAGYGLFWADPVTGVGLVEPMRTEEAYQGRGIASHVLAAGLERLAARGCRRLKVSNDLGLYLRAGFRPLPAATAAVYARGGA